MYSERLIKSTADAMATRGFASAAYNYLIIDDCWMDRKRTPEGKLQGDTRRFPSPMQDVAKYVSITQ